MLPRRLDDPRTPVSLLVVEDDRDIREALNDVLADAGYTVITAGDGVEGLRLLKRYSPQMILLDLNMPVMSGDEFHLVQRLDPVLRGIPTVVLTAMDRIKARTADLEVQGCLAKPVKLGDLLDIIRRICGPPNTGDDWRRASG